MKLLDFLFYYFTAYFTKRKETLTWSTPEQRSAYAIGLMIMSWFIALMFMVEIDVFHNRNFKGEYIYISIPVGILSIWIIKLVFIKNGRYGKLMANKKRSTERNENWYILMSWVLLLVSFALPTIILFLNMN
jgi:hypothetical protein